MTDYDEMTNREIDALVAERVFGWDGIALHDLSFEGECVPQPYGHPPRRARALNKAGYIVPKFTTYWRATGEVVEQMRSLGWHYDITSAPYHPPPDGHCAAFFRSSRLLSKAWNAIGEKTATRAICIAALRAKDGESADE